MACTGFQDVVVVGVIRRVIVIVVGCVSSDDDATWPLLLFLWTARTKTDKVMAFLSTVFSCLLPQHFNQKL
jgi:hypothetical protein